MHDYEDDYDLNDYSNNCDDEQPLLPPRGCLRAVNVAERKLSRTRRRRPPVPARRLPAGVRGGRLQLE